MRFLFAWQRLAPQQQAEGMEGLASVVEQLGGCPAPAAAWEGEILPARVRNWDPAWLDALCLSGRFVWGRATQSAERAAVVRTSPIAIVPRAAASAWRALAADAAPPPTPRPSSHGRAVLQVLRTRGACFFEELVERTGLLRTQVEVALGELVAAGAVSADSFAGLRALVQPRKARGRPRARRRHLLGAGIEQAGRWYLRPGADRAGDGAAAPEAAPVATTDAAVDIVARALLRRYGVVFRRVLEREPGLPPWRDLLRVFRRLEARGEVRGGRFVDLFSGEQFALPEAVGTLRETRRASRDGMLVSVSAADPLNLTGLVTPGERVAALVRNRVLYRDGEPIAVLEAGRARLLVEAPAPQAWELERALVRRPAPPVTAPSPHA
jgi:ATP-dependent Lhr-like helicase